MGWVEKAAPRRGKLRPEDSRDPRRSIARVPTEVLFRSRPDGLMDEPQVEAMLWGFFFRVTRTRDRRSSAMAVGEQPRGARVWDEDANRWQSEAGAPIYSSGPINKPTGLPESSSALLPKHRAIYGWDLATSLVIPPEDLMASCVYTDDLPDRPGNAALPEAQREWRALSLKTKYVLGSSGRAMAEYHCNNCDEEWEAELSESPDDFRLGDKNPWACRRCKARGFIPGTQRGYVEARTKDAWSDEEVRAVKQNTWTLKQVLRSLAPRGYFNLKPKIDEKDAELGTTVLHDPQNDDEILGFKITAAGLAYAEEWAKVHPEFTYGHTILDAMGPTLAAKAPQWVSKEIKSRIPVDEIRSWF